MILLKVTEYTYIIKAKAKVGVHAFFSTMESKLRLLHTKATYISITSDKDTYMQRDLQNKPHRGTLSS